MLTGVARAWRTLTPQPAVLLEPMALEAQAALAAGVELTQTAQLNPAYPTEPGEPGDSCGASASVTRRVTCLPQADC